MSTRSAPNEVDDDFARRDDEIARLRAALDALQRAHDKERREQRATVDRLEEKIRARDEFLAIAAHELRNPMSSIVLGIDALILAGARSGAFPPMIGERLQTLRKHVARFVNRA